MDQIEIFAIKLLKGNKYQFDSRNLYFNQTIKPSKSPFSTDIKALLQ